MFTSRINSILFFLFLAIVLMGCNVLRLGETSHPALPRPIILSSASEIKVPPPPASDSIDFKLEMAELRALQTVRTAQTKTTAESWNAGAVLRWNEIARDLVAQHGKDPLAASRTYTLLSIAQYDTLIAVAENARIYKRRMPDASSSRVEPLIAPATEFAYPSDHAALAATSMAVLSYLFPSDERFLTLKTIEHQESRIGAGVNLRSDIIVGDNLGRQVAARVIAYAKMDGSDADWDGTMPKGEGIWQMNMGTLEFPVRPLWGKVKPWLTQSLDQFRPKPPPAFGSPEFQAALAEVRQISDTRTPEQIRIAQFWEDGKYSVTPPGRWNAIAADLIAQQRLNELDTAHRLTFVNMAMMDAGISCWDTKYTYWLARPSQVDPKITLPVRLPDFPAYTSGHASFSGAASTVLGYFFPAQKNQLEAMAEQAALSRLYGGIHYRFDNEAGLAVGRAIGQLAIERAQANAKSPLAP